MREALMAVDVRTGIEIDRPRDHVSAYANRGEPAGFSAIAAPLMAAAMRRANRRIWSN
jgi:hypothetical protein